MLALALAACGPDGPTPGDGPAAEAGFRRIDGGWYTIEVPQDWQDLPLVGAVQQLTFDRQVGSPAGGPEVRLLVARPRPVAAGTAEGVPAAALLAGQGASASAATTVDAGQLLGGPATRAVTTGTKPDGQPAWFGMWLAVHQGHLFVVDCSGSATGVAVAEDVCPEIVASFRLSGPLAGRSAPPPAEGVTWERRPIGPFRLDVPASWEGLAQEWLEPGQVGGFRAPVPARGPYELHQVTAAVFPDVPGIEVLLQRLDSRPGMRRVHREQVDSPFGPVVRTELSDGLTRRIAIDGVGGRAGFEVACDVPERTVDTTETWCQRVFDSLEVPPPPPPSRPPVGPGRPPPNHGG